MGIPIKIAGMSGFIQDIPFGNLVLIEGSIDPIATIFVQTMASISVTEEIPVRFITSRAEEEVRDQIRFFQDNGLEFPIFAERSHRHWQDHITEKGLTAIDSFSYLNIDRPLADVRRVLEEFLKQCKEKQAIILLTSEQGMLSEQVEVTCRHLADGIFRFLSRDTEQGIRRYIRIPKWMNGQSFDENIYYQFDGREIRVDLRSRVR
jgi:KaiC/GvpD/RAD55 family RecA-like ATPase